MQGLLQYQAMQADTLKWTIHSPGVGISDRGDFVMRGDDNVGKVPSDRIVLGRQWLFQGHKYLTKSPDMWKEAIMRGTKTSVMTYADNLYFGEPTPPPPTVPEDGIDNRLLVGGAIIAGAVVLYVVLR